MRSEKYELLGPKVKNRLQHEQFIFILLLPTEKLMMFKPFFLILVYLF